MYYWLSAIAVLVILLSATNSTAFRWLSRLFASVALAIMIAVPSGVLLMDQDEDEVALALLLAVIFSAAIFWLMKPRPTPLAAIPGETAKDDPRQLKRKTFRRVFPADQIDQVWDRLEDGAPYEAARIAVVRRSIYRSRQALRARHLDLAAHSALVMLEKRIPELIDSELKMASEMPSHAGARVIDELIDLLERFAADCERQLGNHRRLGSSETRLLRQHIERYLDRDGNQPFNHS